jgi:hypothetical protein
MAKLIIEDGGFKIDRNYIGPLSNLREKMQGLTITELVVIGGVSDEDLSFALSILRPTTSSKVLVRGWRYVDLSKYRDLSIFPNPHDLS